MSRVKRLRIQNICGLEDVEIELGEKVTVIEGRNASGKTSHLEAIRAAIGGGHDATLIRDGADEGRAVLLLDDEVEIEKTITRSGSDLKVRHPDFGSVGAPQSFLNGLTDVITFNPVSFLLSKHRVQDLLEAVPMEVSREQLEETLGAASPDGLADVKVEGRHALEVIDEVHRRVYDERTGVNRIAREKGTTAAELRSALLEGHESPVVLEQRLKDAEGAHRDADKVLTQKLASVDTELERELGRIREARDARVRELQEQIRAAEAEAATEMDEARDGARERKDELLVEGRPRVNGLLRDVTALREQLKAADGHERTVSLIQQTEEAAEAARKTSEAMTEALGRLEVLKGRLLDEIPVEGVEIRDAEVLVDGLPFDRVNRARQVQVALGVARLRAGRLPLVCLDNAECLDTETFGALMEQLETADLQAIITRVTDGPLRVRTNGARRGRGGVRR